MEFSTSVISSVLDTVCRVTVAIVLVLVVLSLISSAVEPLYNIMCDIFKWDPMVNPIKQVLPFCAKLMVLGSLAFILTRSEVVINIITKLI